MSSEWSPVPGRGCSRGGRVYKRARRRNLQLRHQPAGRENIQKYQSYFFHCFTFFIHSLHSSVSFISPPQQHKHTRLCPSCEAYVERSIHGCMNLNEDPATRVAAQIVSGIGFLGAGTIYKSGDQVYGLTTAASLWTTAAVGMHVGRDRPRRPHTPHAYKASSTRRTQHSFSSFFSFFSFSFFATSYNTGPYMLKEKEKEKHAVLPRSQLSLERRIITF